MYIRVIRMSVVRKQIEKRATNIFLDAYGKKLSRYKELKKMSTKPGTSKTKYDQHHLNQADVLFVPEKRR